MLLRKLISPPTQAARASSSSSPLPAALAGLIVSGSVFRSSSLLRIVESIALYADHPSSLPLSAPLANHYFPFFPSSATFFYNLLLRAFSRSSRPHLSISFFSSLLRQSIPPDRFTFPSLAVAHSARNFPSEGHQTHGQVLKRGFAADGYVLNTLLSMYSAFADMGSSRKLFDCSLEAVDAVSWNTMIDGYVKSGELGPALKLFDEMPVRNEVSWRTLVIGHAGKGELDVARALFQEMPVIGRNVITWNSMISGFAKQGLLPSARKMFDDMPVAVRNLVSWNAMISGYAANGEMEAAEQLFEVMPERDVVSWSCMIAGYTQNNRHAFALKLFSKMQMESDARPNAVTMVSVLSACAHLAALNQGKWVHSYIDKHKMVLDDEDNLGASLIDMYAKCGSLASASDVFRCLGSKNVSAWNALITGFAINGATGESLDAFEQMLESGTSPNDVTFLAVLGACVHGGLVEDGRRHFANMSSIHGIEPAMKHYGCMVDLFGRAGLLDDAETFVRTMPMKPDVIILGALLGACRIHKNTEVADRIRSDFFELRPRQGGCYVLLSNIYASAGRWSDVSNMRSLLRRTGVRKELVSSSVEIDGVVHEFVAGDRSHLESNEIYSWLGETYAKVKSEGYSPVLDDVFMDLGEEDKENWLSCHSEKLALGFALLRAAQTPAIRIVKNLRICGDCHLFIKCVSKLVPNEIYVRDRIRFHHFKGGSCSCSDYW